MQKSPLFAFLRLQRAFIIYKIIKKTNDGAIRHPVFYSAAIDNRTFALFNENGVPPCSTRVFSSDFSLPIISSPIKFSVFFSYFTLLRFIFLFVELRSFICNVRTFAKTKHLLVNRQKRATFIQNVRRRRKI